MKPEITAATEFLSRIFLAHDNISSEKVAEFRQQLSGMLEERFRNHWHESCPTKGQAYRCIRVCPEEPLDPILEKVCAEVGINAGDFNLPFELTLWVDPMEVVCKFGDLRCSYHIVAKKDNSSGYLNSQTDKLDIDDLLENARDLYLKKQTIIIHPVHSTEIIIPNPFADGSPNCVTMAIRINGTMRYHLSGSPPPIYDGFSQVKSKLYHSTQQYGGFHYYRKSSGGKGINFPNSVINGSDAHISTIYHGYQHHGYQQHHYQSCNDVAFAYNNSYLNSFGGDEYGYVCDEMLCSPPAISMSSLAGFSSSGQIIQSSPTPEQIQQQLQHPPPMPSSISHLQQTFSHASTDIHPQQFPSSSTTTISSTPNCSFSSAAGAGKTTINGSNSKHHDNFALKRHQTSPVKEMK